MAPITELSAGQVFKDYIQDMGLDKNGRRTRSPWQYDPLPDEIQNAPVEFYIYNCGPERKVINAGSMGTHYLMAPKAKGEVGVPLPIKKYEVDWADIGEYKHKANIMRGEDVAREWVTPNGEAETDLRKWGVFASKQNPPLKAEIDEAIRRLEITMDALVKIADQLYESGKRKEITTIYVTAAKWMGISRPWCTISKAMAECPACFLAIEKDAAKCKCGAILDWKKARQFRLVSKEDYEEAVADGLVAGEKKPKADSEALSAKK